MDDGGITTATWFWLVGTMVVVVGLAALSWLRNKFAGEDDTPESGSTAGYGRDGGRP